MTITRIVRRIAVVALFGLIAVSIASSNIMAKNGGTDGKQDSKRGEYSQHQVEKPKDQSKEKKITVSVPEPTGLALLSAAIGALGLRIALLRYRKH